MRTRLYRIYKVALFRASEMQMHWGCSRPFPLWASVSSSVKWERSQAYTRLCVNCSEQSQAGSVPPSVGERLLPSRHA